ncbi:MAG: hypothetical protein LBD34_03205 [Puniceicoccales bacterium]|nr:hypothetical protein [Puniceicoccales bacterium]
MENREKRRQTKWTKGVLAGISLMGSMVCVMLWMMLCGGCRTVGSRLLVPSTLSGQNGELKDINGKLYDYLQILLWVGKNNYDCGGNQRENHKPETGSYRFGNGMLGNRRLRNYDDSESCKPGMENRKLGNRDVGNYDDAESCRPEKENRGSENGKLANDNLRNREVGQKALDGCLEIVGLPDGNEMILTNNINGEGVDRIVRDARKLKARKEKLVGRMGKDVALLEKRYACYESSHRTLRTLQLFGGLACGIVVIFGLVFFRLRWDNRGCA